MQLLPPLSIAFLLLTIIWQPICYGQGSIWTNPITGNNPNTSNPYTTGETKDANLTVSGIGRGTGITGTNANNRYNANGWNSSSYDPDDYFYFTLTPNSGYEIDFSSFVYTSQTSSSSLSNFVIRSSLDNYTADIATPTNTGGNISLSSASYQNITSSITFRIYAWGASASGVTFSINDFTFNGTVGLIAPSNTISTETVTGSPFAVSCPNTTDNGSVDYSATGTFNSGNTFTVQLSNSSGSFSSPTNIGSITSTATSGSINITIPAGTQSGSGYLLRVVSSSPSITSSNTQTITINQTGNCAKPYLTSIIYDGCNDASCDEGNSELVFGYTASESVVASSGNISLRYTTGGSYNLTETFVSNPTKTADLNTNAACPGLFINGFNQTLNANSRFLIVPATVCTTSLDWSNLCGSGPIYILYAQEGTTGDTWHTNGNFGNTGGVKNFEVDIVSQNGLNTIQYEYDPPGAGTNGNYATYNETGGEPATQGNFPNCRITSVALSTELIYFNGEETSSGTNLEWTTASETNNSHFILEYSENGYYWEQIGRITGAFNSQTPTHYSFSHEKNLATINYYRLTSVDFNGLHFEEGIISVNAEFEWAHYNNSLKTIFLNQMQDVAIYSIEGKLVLQENQVNSIPFCREGTFIIKDLETGKTKRILVYE